MSDTVQSTEPIESQEQSGFGVPGQDGELENPRPTSEPRPLSTALGAKLKSSLGYVGAKATAFLLPLLLVRLMSISVYGVYEYALAWATPLSMMLLFGAGASAPYFLIKQNRPHYRSIFHLYCATLALVVVAGSALWAAHLVNLTVYLSFVTTIAFTSQTVYASLFRTDGHPALTSLAETGGYVVLFVVVLLLLPFRIYPQLGWIGAVIALYSVALGIDSLRRLRKEGLNFDVKAATKALVHYGIPFMGSALLISALITSGRLLAGNLVSMSALGEYGFYFRMTSALLLIHQLITNLFFLRIYRFGRRGLDLYFASLISVILLAGATLFWLGPYTLGRFVPLMKFATRDQRELFLVLSVQATYWAATSMLEIPMGRENLARRQLFAVACSVTLLLAVVFTVRALHMLTLLRLAQICMTSIFGFFLAQCAILWIHKIRLRFVPILGTTIYVAYFFFDRLLLAR